MHNFFLRFGHLGDILFCLTINGVILTVYYSTRSGIKQYHLHTLYLDEYMIYT
jgi:hypothetical protein